MAGFLFMDTETKSGARHSQSDMQMGRKVKAQAREIADTMDALGFADEPAPIEFDPGKSITLQGAEVKALGGGRVGGYLVRFSSADSPDLTGDYFTPETDFGEHDSAPVLYHHGQDETLKNRVLGKGKLSKDDVGMWVEAQLELRDQYEKAVYALAEKGKLGWSSGTASHLVERQMEGKAARITRWPLGLDASLTPTPAEPRNAALSLKAIIAELEKAERPASNDAPAEAVSTENPQGKHTETQTMDTENKPVDTQLTDTLNALMAEVKGLKEQMKQEPPVKTAGIAEVIADGKAPAVIGAPLDEASDQLHELKSFLNNTLDPDSKRQWAEYNAKARNMAANRDHQKAFDRWIRSPGNYEAYQEARNAQMKTALAEGTASLGGNLVPVLYNNTLVGNLKEDSILRRAGAYQFPVAGTNSLKVTTITRSASAALVAEAASVAGQEPTFGLVSFDAYAYKASAIASRETLADSRFDVSSVLIDNFGWQFIQSENNQFAIGTGSNQPQGLAVGATLSVSGGSTLAIATASGDNVLNLYHSLPYQYRGNAVWFANDQVLKAIRQTKWATTTGGGSTTTYNEYLWPITGDEVAPFGRLLGRPVFPLNTMASSGSTANVLVFADPRFFWISDFALGGTEIQQLNERYADNWQVGWNAWRRFDSNLMVAEAAQAMRLV